MKHWGGVLGVVTVTVMVTVRLLLKALTALRADGMCVRNTCRLLSHARMQASLCASAAVACRDR